MLLSYSEGTLTVLALCRLERPNRLPKSLANWKSFARKLAGSGGLIVGILAILFLTIGAGVSTVGLVPEVSTYYFWENGRISKPPPHLSQNIRIFSGMLREDILGLYASVFYNQGK